MDCFILTHIGSKSCKGLLWIGLLELGDRVSLMHSFWTGTSDQAGSMVADIQAGNERGHFMFDTLLYT